MTNAKTSNERVYLVSGKRTPFGKFGGSLKDISPVDLAVHSSKAAMDDVNIKPEQIDHVILGCVIPASTDTLYGGRHLALKLGCPIEVPGYTLNRLCGSGIQSILDAARLIKLSEARCVIAAGTENMSMTPHLTYGARFGTKYGSLKNVDLLLDSLTDKYAGAPMAITAENLSEKFNVDRSSCEIYSMNSHQKAQAAFKAGHFNEEIAPVELKRMTLDYDEHVRADISMEDMSKLKPSFREGGVVTPATASGIVDGASSVIVASESFCQENNLSPLAEIIDGKVIGVDPTIMGIGPSPAIKMLLASNDLTLSDIDLFEINEAFAGQVLSCLKDVEIPQDKLNIWGGAVAIGHPLAATGTRISLTLARQLNTLNKKYGVASACIGGGQGISILLKKVD